MNKRIDIATLESRHFDVILIGGGINGAAGAQQLATRGYEVLVVDKNDFGSGSTARSSRLLHCGLRYLAPGGSMMDFVKHPRRLKTSLKMSKLAVEARHDFVSSTPGRIQLARLHFPVYKKGPYSGWQVDLAFKVLKRFNRGKIPLNYERLNRSEAIETPLVAALRDTDNLESVAVYDEFQMSWPERVTADCLVDAVRCGAIALNYTEASLGQQTNTGWEVNLKDGPSGDVAMVTGKVIIAAAGIWIDKVLGSHRRGKPPKVLGTKGAHITVELPSDYQGDGIATINSKMEPFYCLPWGKYHYIGPTEVLYEENLDRIRTTTSDRDWLLSEAQQVFPGLNLSKKDIKYTWSGVRPLTWDVNMPGGNRERVLHNLAPDGLENVFAMTGGPVMTHRSAGIEIADAVSSRLQANKRAVSPLYISEFPDPQDQTVIKALSGLIEEPIWMESLLTSDSIVHLSDVLIRRSGLVWFQQLSHQQVRLIGEHLGARLGWDSSKVEDEIQLFNTELELIQGIEP